MTDHKRIEFKANDLSAIAGTDSRIFGSGLPRLCVTAFLPVPDAEDLLCTLAADIGFKRVVELLEVELREAMASPMEQEQQ